MSTLGGGLAAPASSSQSLSNVLFKSGGKVWRGERLDFDAPDNVDLDNQITFSPPPPPDSPKHMLTYGQMKRVEDRIKLAESDSFERGLAVDAFKTKWAGFLPKLAHMPLHIPLPKDMTVEEVEEIQAKLSAEGNANAKGRGRTAPDPVFGNVVERMRRKQAADEVLAANSRVGPHKSAVQLALERLSFSSKDALAVFEDEHELQEELHQRMATGGGGSGGGHPAVADRAMQDKLAAAAAAAKNNPRVAPPRRPAFRSAGLRQRAEDGASDDGEVEEAAAGRLFHAHRR